MVEHQMYPKSVTDFMIEALVFHTNVCWMTKTYSVETGKARNFQSEASVSLALEVQFDDVGHWNGT